MNEHETTTHAANDSDDQPPPESGHRPHRPLVLEVFDPQHLLTQSQHDQLATLAKKVFALIPNPGHLRARVVDDQRMSQDHLKFSGIKGTTDVLTFDLADQSTHTIDDYTNKVIDADLTICFDQATRQAAKKPHDTVHELLLYIVHGLLHCLGYNDHSDEDYKRMHHKEDELFTRAGINPIFFAHEDTDIQHEKEKGKGEQS